MSTTGTARSRMGNMGVGLSRRKGRGNGTRIVATGCTSGIGFQALRQLLLASPSSGDTCLIPPPPYHIVLLARKGSGKGEGPRAHALRACQELEALAAAAAAADVAVTSATAQEEEERKTWETHVEVREMDLASLESVRLGAGRLLDDLHKGTATTTTTTTTTTRDKSGEVDDTMTAGSLSSISSAKAFAEIAAGRIDVLLLNAAVAKGQRILVHGEQQSNEMDMDADTDTVQSGIDSDRILKGRGEPRDKLRDANGRYEETACVNHVSQQLLVALLSSALLTPTNSQPGMTATGDSATMMGSKGGTDSQSPSSSSSFTPRVPRIVFTGSALHRRLKSVEDLSSYFDPTSTSPWSLMGSYGASKFLQMLGIQCLIKQLQSASLSTPSTFSSLVVPPSSALLPACKIEIVCVQPGFIPTTNLSRESSLLARFATKWILPLLAPLLSFVASVEQGGEMILLGCFASMDKIGFQQTSVDQRKVGEGTEETSLDDSSLWLSVNNGGGGGSGSGGNNNTATVVSAALLVRSQGNTSAPRTPSTNTSTREDRDETAQTVLQREAVPNVVVRQRPDVRTEEVGLQDIWWPDIVRREWHRQAEFRS